MALSNNYDWIVLGDHPGALLSANLAAKLGLSVLILPRSSTQRVSFSPNGQCLDPESNFIVGITEGGLLYETLRQLGAAPSESELADSGTLTQALTPHGRLLLQKSRESIQSEIGRELADHSIERELIEQGMNSKDTVLEYWRQLPTRFRLDLTRKGKPPKEAPANWDDLLKRLQKKGVSIDADLLSAVAYGVSGQLSQGWSGAEWVHALALAQSGASFRGGMSAYRRMLLRSAKKLGAAVLEDAECRRIFVENRRFVGIQVSSSANMISGVGCILGSTLSEYADRLSFTGPRWLRRASQVPKPVGWKFTIALTVRAEAVVPGCSRRMVWKEPGAPVLEIEIADPAEYGSKEPDHKLVFLRTVLPFTQESLGVVHQRMAAARMFRLATEIMPFLEYHVTRVYPDFRSSAATAPRSLEARDELSEAYGYAMPQLIPENLRVYGAGKKNPSAGVEGLFVAAGESLPTLGTLGPTVAALEATAWVAHRSGLPGPLN